MKRTLATLVVVALLAHAHAAVTDYSWVSPTTPTSSGLVKYDPDTGTLVSYAFHVPSLGIVDGTLGATISVLPDGHLFLGGGSFPSGGAWDFAPPLSPGELIFVHGPDSIFGSWVPVAVPEASSYIAGVAVLAMLGMSRWRGKTTASAH